MRRHGARIAAPPAASVAASRSSKDYSPILEPILRPAIPPSAQPAPAPKAPAQYPLTSRAPVVSVSPATLAPRLMAGTTTGRTSRAAACSTLLHCVRVSASAATHSMRSTASTSSGSSFTANACGEPASSGCRSTTAAIALTGMTSVALSTAGPASRKSRPASSTACVAVPAAHRTASGPASTAAAAAAAAAPGADGGGRAEGAIRLRHTRRRTQSALVMAAENLKGKSTPYSHSLTVHFSASSTHTAPAGGGAAGPGGDFTAVPSRLAYRGGSVGSSLPPHPFTGYHRSCSTTSARTISTAPGGT
mmetsp:Transcript_17812/g.46500  ORF Transcript_17812/g.46500 Transcript_17812/m.46500 type:complete len:306 (+) Transcript_17812:156-1073(+)